MAPTGTTTNATSTDPGGDSSGDTIGRVSLYIAIAALAISSLLAAMQLLFSYVTSSAGRNKTNAAALGEWHRHTRLSMREAWKAKLHVSYGVMDLSQRSLLQDLQKQAKARRYDANQLDNYRLQAQLSRAVTKDGYQFRSEKVRALRKNFAEDIEVPLSELSRSERAALKRFQESHNRHHKQKKSSHASYVMLAHHLNFDFTTFVPTRYEDADQIPMGCSAPLNTIRMSDLISFGYLLDMNIQEANPSTGEILMTGQQCKIYSEHLPNVGLVSRYDGVYDFIGRVHATEFFLVKAHGYSTAVHSLTDTEHMILMKTAQGTVGCLETLTSMSLLGYNSIARLVDLFLAKAQGDAWQEISLGDNKKSIRSDEDGRWNRRWANPETSLTAALLACICMPTVAKGFPHIKLLHWTENEARFSEATRNASLALQQANYTMIAPSDDFIPSMYTNDHVKSTSYKVADNFGCQYGGLRGYLSTNQAQFTKIVASCWPWLATADTREHPPVPILLELIHQFQNGTPLTSWAASYRKDKYKAERWTMTPRGALWIQLMMFDTWIGCMIDRLMGATALKEVPIPAELDEATACAEAAAGITQNNATNPVRLRWLKLYLCRLAEGHLGRGDSFMSSEPREDLEGRWEEMEVGTPNDWLVLDAVITMRAATMYAMLMELDDSSVMLELTDNDPLLYMT